MASITQLEYLLALDKHKHFGAAAKACHVSQPTLSAQIQKLEEEYDCIFFDRSKKPILVTERGKEVISQARVIIKEFNKLDEIAKASDLELQGNFRLGVIPTLAPSVLPLFVKSFAINYPKVKLLINEFKTEDIVTKLASDELDAGLAVTPLQNHNIIEKALFHEEFMVYLAKDHPLLKKNSLSSKDLDNQNIWLLEEGHCFRNQALNVCSHQKDVYPNLSFEGGSLETLVNLVKKGTNSLTLVPSLSTKGLDKKYLRSFKSPVPSREVSLIYSRSFLKERIILALEEEILNSLPKEIASLKKGQFKTIGL